MDNLEFEFQDIMEFHTEEHGPVGRHLQGAHHPAPEPGAAAGAEEFADGPPAFAPSSFQFDDERELPAVIMVVGVGGCGGNAVSTMVQAGIRGVRFVAANTDRQALDGTGAPNKVQFGAKLTRGRGAGANPEVGRNAALEDADRIKSLMDGTEMVFITAGMGGGTGTGAAPVFARLAREAGALAVGVVTKPFSIEGARRMRYAEEGLAELKKNVDALIVIPNDRLINLSEKHTRTTDAFKLSDDVLVQAVRGISDVVLVRGRVNVDFADVKTVMANQGRAVMGMGVAKGAARAIEAAQKAISSPLLEDSTITGARAVLINITGGSDLGMGEIDEVMSIIKAEVDPEANIIFGLVDNAEMAEEIMVTVIATGFDEAGSRGRVKQRGAITSLKDYHSEMARRRNERPATRMDVLEARAEDLDKPTFLRRQAD